VCGDGVVGDDEECDDGDVEDADGCESDCTRTITALVGGRFDTCIVTRAGAMRCWGSAIARQLGYDDNEDVGDDETPASVGDVDVGQSVVQVVIGDRNTCALLDDGTVRCWGDNHQGEAGYGHTDFITGVPSTLDAVALGADAVALAAGWHHVCAVLEDGTVRCWGVNGSGQLGLGHTETIGDDELPDSEDALDFGATPLAIVAGDSHTCVLLDDGGVHCWGVGAEGRLGYASTNNVGDDELASAQGDVDIGFEPAEIRAGGDHTCARAATGEVRCWGRGLSGALGYGNFASIGDGEPPSAAGDVMFGDTAVGMGLGVDHTCVITSVGSVRCWGADQWFQLGYPGVTETIGDDETPVGVGEVDVGGTVVQLAAGNLHTCALLTSGALRCWGDPSNGALGYGNTNIIGDDESPADAGDVPVF
jgi:cysteine-rich repeat protein